jgi:hypothetical protein
MKTNIGGKAVPVRAGPKTIVHFSGGMHGLKEAGRWAFWTVKGSDKKSLTGRCRPNEDAGKRFRDMETRPIEKNAWLWVIKYAQHVRPALRKDVSRWLDKHPEDAGFAKSAVVGGKKLRVTAKFELRAT